MCRTLSEVFKADVWSPTGDADGAAAGMGLPAHLSLLRGEAAEISLIVHRHDFAHLFYL